MAYITLGQRCYVGALSQACSTAYRSVVSKTQRLVRFIQDNAQQASSNPVAMQSCDASALALMAMQTSPAQGRRS